MNSIANRLREARAKKELTQAQVASIAKINTSTYSSYEAGKIPPLDTAKRISQVLEVSLDWLCGEAQEIRMTTYGDAIRALNCILDTFKVNVVPKVTRLADVETHSVSFRIDDEKLYDFFNKDKRLNSLFAESKKTEDVIEVYYAWLEKELGTMDNIQIDQVENSHTNSEEEA